MSPTPSGAALREAVERDYAAYANGDGDGRRNWSDHVRAWGYTTRLLEAVGLHLSEEQRTQLFSAACGGGCPLTMPHGAPAAAGECVVDLGCGAGHDCLLASCMVGPSGTVIGVDLTQAMLNRAARNADEFGAKGANIDFRHGVLDDGKHLAGVVDADSADLVISNGVFNLAVDKAAAFRAAYRVCKPGGRIQLCDVCKIATVRS